MTSPYLSTWEAAEYLRFVNRATGQPELIKLWRWLKRHKVPTKRRGRAVLVHRDDLEAALTKGVTS